MDQHSPASGDDRPSLERQFEQSKLSYKFQRLRERLRAAVASGELSGKLPGERQLAKKFHVNAKTLSKALTDLAAEGLLERNIGRGTFVKGSTGVAVPQAPKDERWLVICDSDQLNSGIILYLRGINPNLQVVTDTAPLRPSFLNPIKAVIDLSYNTPEEFLRDLVVRNIAVVLVGREPRTYSVNAVLVDRALGAWCLARDMMLGGHRRFLAVEHRGQTAVAEALRRAAHCYAPDAVVDSVFANDVATAIENHASTAIICDSRKNALVVRAALARRSISIPGQVSLGAIGSGFGEYPCSGYFVHSEQKAQTVVQLLRESNLKRPTTLWLTGAFADNKTIGAPHVMPVDGMTAQHQQLPGAAFLSAAPKS